MKKIFFLAVTLLLSALVSTNVSFAQQQGRTGGVKPAKPTTNTQGTVNNGRPTTTTTGAESTTTQQDKENKKSPEELATMRTENLKKRLLLNADQEKITYEAYLKFFRVVNKAKATYPNKGEEYAKLIRDSRINRDSEILKALNPEQAKKFKNIRDKQVEKGKSIEKGKGHGKGHGKGAENGKGKAPKNHQESKKDKGGKDADDDDDDEIED